MAETEAPADGGHHLPAVEDWPRGFGEASWWPFVTAVGAAGLYVGAALPRLAGPATFVASTAVLLLGLYGWVYHAFVADFWSGEAGHGGTLRWGMVLFLGTEVATFGAGFVYYAFIRVGTWPPHALPHLVSSLVIANTAVLVLSSVTLHAAHVALLRDRRRRFLRLLGLTLALGLLFLAGQAYEYWAFVVEEGLTVESGIYFSAFFGLTGLHGLHVTMGVVLLAILTVRALYGQYAADRHVSVSTVSMYWHFVDAVWIVLVAVLYVGAAVGT